MCHKLCSPLHSTQEQRVLLPFAGCSEMRVGGGQVVCTERERERDSRLMVAGSVFRSVMLSKPRKMFQSKQVQPRFHCSL